jgi:transcription termination factor Rho
VIALRILCSKGTTMRKSNSRRYRSSSHKRQDNCQSHPQKNKPAGEVRPCRGVLELHSKGYGFLRRPEKGFARRQDDTFVPETFIDRWKLRQGAAINGAAQDNGNGTGERLIQVEQVDGCDAETCLTVLPFDERTPTNPTSPLRLEHPEQPVSMRVLDLLCPLGRGQRALIAAPPRAGKTTILRQIGRSIFLNHPDVHLMALLVDERPEEVTEMRAELSGEVFASSLDQTVESHTHLSRLVIDRCQRLVERGKDVVLLVDSLTRLSRAFNKLPRQNGPIGAGGLNIRALDIPRQLFAAARPCTEGGSLTIIASVLVETDNRMDEVIFREFKGTGNLDLVLSQQLADRGIWPAIDLSQSATRRVELIHDRHTLQAVTALRNTLLNMHPTEAMKELTAKLERFDSNAEFINLISGSMV